MKTKFKVLKLLLTVIAGIAIVIAVTFIISSYTRLNDKAVAEESLYNSLYVTADNSVQLLIGADLGEVRMNISDTVLTGSLNENIIKLTGGGAEYTFIVIDGSTLFGDVTGYMYRVAQ